VSQTLQNLVQVILVNRLSWEEHVPDERRLHSTADHGGAFRVRAELPLLVSDVGENDVFCVVTVNPGLYRAFTLHIYRVWSAAGRRCIVPVESHGSH
jgi:hypothetical protein